MCDLDSICDFPAVFFASYRKFVLESLFSRDLGNHFKCCSYEGAKRGLEGQTKSCNKDECRKCHMFECLGSKASQRSLTVLAPKLKPLRHLAFP